MTVKSKVTAKGARSKRKSNLLKLCSEMSKHVIDAVDKEVTKRFKTLIDTSEEDITKSSLDHILRYPDEVEISSYKESLQPYVKHYIFMVKRVKAKVAPKRK